MVWAIEQPTAGIVEADELDYRRVLEVARPYLGPVVGAYSDWTPLGPSAGPVPRGHRPGRPLAVQEHPGRLTRLHPSRDSGRALRGLLPVSSPSTPLPCGGFVGMTPKLRRFLDQVRPSTPYLVVDVDVVEANYLALAAALDGVQIFYAVKANPAPEILSAAGRARQLVRRREPRRDRDGPGRRAPTRAGSPTATRSRRRPTSPRAFALGVRLFAFDSEAELDKIARAAPGRRVFCRILTSGRGCRLAAVAQVRLHARHGARAAGPRRRPGRRALGRLVPCRLAAEGPGRLGRGAGRGRRPVPRPRGRRHRARHGQSRRRLPHALPHRRARRRGLWRGDHGRRAPPFRQPPARS